LTLKILYIIINKKVNMKIITKAHINITIDKNLKYIIDEEIGNRSKYIEWLIYQDLKQKLSNEKIKKILI